jgi:hypothetical protein
MLVTDRPLLVCVAVWVIVLALIIYWSQIPILKGLSG